MYNKEIRKIVNVRRRLINTFVIRWQMTFLCDYACDFCIQGSRLDHLDASKTESYAKRKAIADSLKSFIETKIPKGKIVELFLIGGEVTVLPDFMSLLSDLVNCRFEGTIVFHITTNLSKSGKYYADIVRLFSGHPDRILFLSASFYRQYTTEEIVAEKVAEMDRLDNFSLFKGFRFCRWLLMSVFGRLPLWLYQRNVFFSVGWPILDDESYYAHKKFMRIVPSTSPIIMRDYPVKLSDGVRKALREGLDSQSKWSGIAVYLRNKTKCYFKDIQQLGYQLEDKDKFCPDGYLCDAGHDSFSIDNDGKVWRCPSIGHPSDFFMGDLTKGSFSLFKKYTVCHSSHCSCSYYKIIKK